MVLSGLRQADFERLKEVCEKAGIRLTHQRLEIYREAVSGGLAGHPSAEEIYHRLQERMPTLALDTVYRTLSTFEELGIIRRLHLAGKQVRFDANIEPHHHFICRICGRIDDFSWPEFDAFPLPEEIARFGKVSIRHLELHGVCRECLARE